MPQPTPETLRKRKIVGVNGETVTNVTSTDFPGHYPGEDHSWDLQDFRDNFRVEFHKNTPTDAVFSLIGLDASLANALRRILLADLPTLAIEDVFVEQNTSIIQDEVLAHRLGLIPLRASHAGLRWLKWRRKPANLADDAVADSTSASPATGDPATDFNTVVLKLKVECDWAEDGQRRAKRGETDPNLLYTDAHVYARHLRFEPIGQQRSRYFTAEAGPVEPVHPDILIAKLRPGQVLDVTMHAVLGAGGDHAKFSPVATASYRLLPVIEILAPILGAEARKFARCFPKGVIGLEEVTAEEAGRQGSGVEGREGEVKAVVRNAIADTVSRECLRHEEFSGKVRLGRQRDHFIFSVESTGQWDGDELFLDSVKVLRRKCERLKRGLAELRQFG